MKNVRNTRPGTPLKGKRPAPSPRVGDRDTRTRGTTTRATRGGRPVHSVSSERAPRTMARTQGGRPVAPPATAHRVARPASRGTRDRGPLASRSRTPVERTPRAEKPGVRAFSSRPTSPRFTPTTPRRKAFKAPKPPRTQKVSYASPQAKESWGDVAQWYEKHLTEEDTYHTQVILPNLLRLMAPRRGDEILDLACGTGFFSSAFAKEGALVTGIDISEELIDVARKHAPSVSYHVASATKADIVSPGSKQKASMILAIQNIERTAEVCAEAFRVLKPGGSFHIVMNHPAFRIPKHSSWEYDEKKRAQYRRIDAYLSESSSAIAMHPGIPGSPETISFHRPIQFYFKALTKAGFTIDKLEEWISHKESTSGPRAKAENTARKEVPLFLYLSARKPL